MKNLDNVTLAITHRFSSLAAAVQQAKLDLSYNEDAAKAKIADLDRPFRANGYRVDEAYVLENGEVWYRYVCDIKILSKFEPFSSVLHDGSFYPVVINPTSITIVKALPLPRNARKAIAGANLTVTTL